MDPLGLACFLGQDWVSLMRRRLHMQMHMRMHMRMKYRHMAIPSVQPFFGVTYIFHIWLNVK